MKPFHDIQGNNGRAAGQEPSPARGAPVDVEALAERVYRLLLEEIRLDRARGALGHRPREW